MIDFDYVRHSFYLADAAQLLTYLLLRQRIDRMAYLRAFIAEIFLSDSMVSELAGPFSLAMIQSNFASIQHNKNISQNTRHELYNQIDFLMTELGII